MTETPSVPGYYNTRQAAQKLGVSEGRIHKLASIYGWEYCTIESTKLFSAADIYRYVKVRQHLRELNDAD